MMPNESTRIDWRLCLLLFGAVFLLALPQAALLPLLDRDEPRFAEASREMRQSGKFIVPTFNHAPRYAKPAADLLVPGGVASPFSARTPWPRGCRRSLPRRARRVCCWSGPSGSRAPRIGFGAALGYAFCFQAIQQGRVATADALLIFFMTATGVRGLARSRSTNAGPVRHPACVTMLALGLGFGFLAKGPEAWLPLIPLFVCARGLGAGTIMRIVLALLAGAILVLLWAIPAYLETHGDYWAPDRLERKVLGSARSPVCRVTAPRASSRTSCSCRTILCFSGSARCRGRRFW